MFVYPLPGCQPFLQDPRFASLRATLPPRPPRPLPRPGRGEPACPALSCAGRRGGNFAARSLTPCMNKIKQDPEDFANRYAAAAVGLFDSIEAACAAAPDWPRGVRSATRSALAFLASEPTWRSFSCSSPTRSGARRSCATKPRWRASRSAPRRPRAGRRSHCRGCSRRASVGGAAFIVLRPLRVGEADLLPALGPERQPCSFPPTSVSASRPSGSLSTRPALRPGVLRGARPSISASDHRRPPQDPLDLLAAADIARVRRRAQAPPTLLRARRADSRAGLRGDVYNRHRRPRRDRAQDPRRHTLQGKDELLLAAVEDAIGATLARVEAGPRR